MLEITKPAPQHRVQTFDNMLDAIPTCALGFGSDAIPQRFQALFADPTFAGFEAVTQKLEALPRNRTVSDMRLVRMKAQTVLGHPSTYLGKCRLGRFPARTHHDKVSRSREPPPQPLSEPGVNLSAHRAPITQPPVLCPSSSEEKARVAFGQFYPASFPLYADGLLTS